MIIILSEMITLMISIFVFSIMNKCLAIDNNRRNCRERERLIETEKGDLYALIDATIGQKLTLQCHFCSENDDSRPKNWYKIDNLGDFAPHEVDLDMKNNASLNKIQVNNEHSLIIHDFDNKDRGLYYCKRLEGENDEEEKYNYLVDPSCWQHDAINHERAKFKFSVVYDENVTSVETGNLTDWGKFHEEYFAPINTLLSESHGTEFEYLRNNLSIEVEMVMQWQNWGICEVCGRPKNEGVRKKIGFCRLKMSRKNENSSRNLDDAETFLVNVNKISCRSQILGRLVPGISNLTRIIPNFVQVQPCEGTCNPDAEGLGKGWKAGKTSAFKYRKTVVLAENSHLTIICPESTLENVVVWKKNGKVLKAGESVVPPNPEDEPRIIVDTFNTLYLIDVQESEEGNYTCQVDDIRMQQTVVFIVSKARLLTQAFVRHLMYLGLILSLTLPCYCAGILIACHRRRKFKDYQELREIEDEKIAKRGFIRLP